MVAWRFLGIMTRFPHEATYFQPEFRLPQLEQLFSSVGTSAGHPDCTCEHFAEQCIFASFLLDFSSCYRKCLHSENIETVDLRVGFKRLRCGSDEAQMQTCCCKGWDSLFGANIAISGL